MADKQISQADIDALAAKIDQFGAGLSDAERNILLGVFARARETLQGDMAAATQSQPDEVSGFVVQAPTGATESSLSEGFRDVFAPSGAGGFSDEDTAGYMMRDEIDVSVTGTWKRS